MKYLLDTNAFILLNLDFEALPLSYQRIFADGENTFVLSPATVWEMAIKVRLGKLNLNGISLDALTGQLRSRLKIALLPIKQIHLLDIARLPKVKGQRPRRPVRFAHHYASIDRKSAGADLGRQVSPLRGGRSEVASAETPATGAAGMGAGARG